MRREISMEALFAGTRDDYIVPPQVLSCHRMIVGRLFCGYGINPSQRDYILWWLKTEPDFVEITTSMALVWEYGMGHYTPDFREPSYFSHHFDPITWRECRDHWIKEMISRRATGNVPMPPAPPRYDEWLGIWGTYYERRGTAQPQKEEDEWL